MLAEVLAVYMIWIIVKSQKKTNIDIQGRLILSEPHWLQVDDWLIYK